MTATKSNKKTTSLYATGLYGLCCCRLYQLMKDLKLDGDKIVPIAEVYKRLCSSFSARKEIINETLAFLRDTGSIQRSNQGIKINFVVENIDTILKKNDHD